MRLNVNDTGLGLESSALLSILGTCTVTKQKDLNTLTSPRPSRTLTAIKYSVPHFAATGVSRVKTAVTIEPMPRNHLPPNFSAK